MGNCMIYSFKHFLQNSKRRLWDIFSDLNFELLYQHFLTLWKDVYINQCFSKNIVNPKIIESVIAWFCIRLVEMDGKVIHWIPRKRVCHSFGFCPVLIFQYILWQWECNYYWWKCNSRCVCYTHWNVSSLRRGFTYIRYKQHPYSSGISR